MSAPHGAAAGAAVLNGAALSPGAMRLRVREGDSLEVAGVAYAVKRARSAPRDGAELLFAAPPSTSRSATVSRGVPSA